MLYAQKAMPLSLLRQQWEQGLQNIPGARRGPAAPLGVGVRYRMGCFETEFINRSVAIMSCHVLS